MPDDFFMLHVGSPSRQNGSPIKLAATRDPATDIYSLSTSGGGGGGGGQAGTVIVDASAPNDFTPGQAAVLQADESGALLVNQCKLTRVDDKVSADPNQYATVSTATPVTADGSVFTLAAGEKGFIQNLTTTALYVKFGASASSSSFNFVLKGGTATDDGLGGSREINDWIGVVSIAKASGSTRAIAYKLS